MPFVVTCMDLEVNMLSEVWQKRQKHNITYTENLRNSLGGCLVLWWFAFSGFAAMATFIHIGDLRSHKLLGMAKRKESK